MRQSGVPDIAAKACSYVCACVCVSLPDPNAVESRQEEQIDGGTGGGVPASQRQDIRTRCERELFFFLFFFFAEAGRGVRGGRELKSLCRSIHVQMWVDSL